MAANFQTSNLVRITSERFREHLENLLTVRDGRSEGYRDDSKQRDLSVRFHWGHNHDFGDFRFEGRMRDRHLTVPAVFHDLFHALPLDLAGKRILDVGVWTGGTSLLLHALGGDVVALEEVRKYAGALEFLKESFALNRLAVLNRSIYEMIGREFSDAFDFVMFAGVLYHVTDPVLALRIIFNSLRNGGTVLVETACLNEDTKTLRYEGPETVHGGSQEHLDRGGWNWFIPSPPALRQMLKDVGFQDIRIELLEDRAFAVARRIEHCDMMRAGLSVRDVR